MRTMVTRSTASRSPFLPDRARPLVKPVRAKDTSLGRKPQDSPPQNSRAAERRQICRPCRGLPGDCGALPGAHAPGYNLSPLRGSLNRIGNVAAIRKWALVAAFLLGAVACATTSVQDRFSCSDDVLAQWQIPAGWVVRELTPAQARAEVVTANVSKDSAEAGWQALESQRRDGDRYWLYRRPETDTINALGAQEGVVLIRGCEQLGFVTTRIATEPATAR